MKRLTIAVLLCLALFTLVNNTAAAGSIVIGKSDSTRLVNRQVSFLKVSEKDTTPAAAILRRPDFIPNQSPILTFMPGTGVYWIKMEVENRTAFNTLYLEIPYMNISRIDLYKFSGGRADTSYHTGNTYPYGQRPYPHQHFVFDLQLPAGKKAVYLLKIDSQHTVFLPLIVTTPPQLLRSLSLVDLILGIYVGILLAIFAYNLFIYLSTRERSYYSYLIYILSLGLAQTAVAGYLYRYIWPGTPSLNYYGTVFTTSLAGIFAILFAQQFLKIRSYMPRTNYVLHALNVMFAAAFVLSLLRLNNIAYPILNISSMTMGVVLLVCPIYIMSRGNYVARYYLLAWAAFLIGLIVLVLRNVGILPYNNFTTYISYFGSALEAVLLSLALANKINEYRKEKEESQALALKVSQENERLVREQNLILETKVRERTEDLQATNRELNVALHNLKEAQSQLVEKEKMASLGQLTAGIAHEINNPINFVTSNIKPLKLDIEDIKSLLARYEDLPNQPDIAQALQEIEQFKREIDIDYIHEEINSLIAGIENGASRTAEIVKGLRTFSRLDESEVKSVDLHQGLDSTLVLLRNSIPPNVKVIRNYGSLPKIECYAGKINQVFMNILTNAFNAIKTKGGNGEEAVTITTGITGEQAVISIKDTGTGMTEQVKEKIFDPFFTTKDVGEGTGLGLSIVFSIIEKHHGRIVVESEPGKGAEFIIYLPMNMNTQPS